MCVVCGVCMCMCRCVWCVCGVCVCVEVGGCVGVGVWVGGHVYNYTLHILMSVYLSQSNNTLLNGV